MFKRDILNLFLDVKVSELQNTPIVTFALEMRRRVKEQLRRINPSEFARTDLTYVDKATGQEFATPPISARLSASSSPKK